MRDSNIAGTLAASSVGTGAPRKASAGARKRQPRVLPGITEAPKRAMFGHVFEGLGDDTHADYIDKG